MYMKVDYYCDTYHNEAFFKIFAYLSVFGPGDLQNGCSNFDGTFDGK